MIKEKICLRCGKRFRITNRYYKQKYCSRECVPGHVAWNKGMKMKYTEARRRYDERQRGVTKPKPKNFSETMRKVNPPSERKTLSSGYIYIYKPEYEGSIKKKGGYGFIPEHRYLLGKFIGRVLTPQEKVHHINGIKHDNRIENLFLCRDHREHNMVHGKMEELVFKLIREGRVYFDGKEFVFRRDSVDREGGEEKNI